MKAKTKKKVAKPAKKKTPGKAKTKSVTKTNRKTTKSSGPKAKRPAKAARKGPAVAAKPSKATKKPAKRGRKKTSSSKVSSHRKTHSGQRDVLLRKQAELMQAYTISKGDSQSHLDSGTEDYIDYAVNSYAREFLLSLSELDRKQLLLVEDALRRIDRGEYGDCQQCGEPIAPKRLEVAPWARYCVRCQELEEKGLLPQTSAISFGDEEDYDEGETEDVEEEDLGGEGQDEPEGDDDEQDESTDVEEELGNDESQLDDEEPED